MSAAQATIFLIPVLAVLAPLLARGVGVFVRVPVVVFELMLGILVGPAVLGWAAPSEFVELLSEFGLAMLFFVAGSEIQLSAFRGRTGRRAVGGWFVSIALGIAVGWLIAPGEAAIVIAIALSSTALGTILPMLRDNGELRTPFGKAVGAIGAVGEFAPLVAISIFLGGRDPGIATIVLIAFVLVAALAIWWAFRAPQGALHRFVNATLHTSGQFAIRVVFLVLGALVVVSLLLDLDMLLGAFTAGIVWRLVMRDAAAADRDAVESKIEGVAFGFLVPVFFIYTGVTFDLEALLADPELLLLLPIGLAGLLLVRGLPSMLAAPADSRPRDRAAVVFFGATGLPIIVAVTNIGVDEKILSSGLAAALVGIGMLSVLVFPVIGTTLRGDAVGASLPVAEERL
ncbi:cation:proton antiporter [Microbacterium sp. RU33B]|uniref:cation:proton antiporter n=1 Tax=Microbacterium sp. RU33B TaxID=1907390 RepID=UPI000961D122|nr:cation:proton antiporter [Microbacterium sp. RU33B]SIT87295.1 transporter, CPA2 family [Microbacterium sp. RU33B]